MSCICFERLAHVSHQPHSQQHRGPGKYFKYRRRRKNSCTYAGASCRHAESRRFWLPGRKGSSSTRSISIRSICVTFSCTILNLGFVLQTSADNIYNSAVGVPPCLPQSPDGSLVLRAHRDISRGEQVGAPQGLPAIRPGILSFIITIHNKSHDPRVASCIGTRIGGI
jgi:hypothetical protein